MKMTGDLDIRLQELTNIPAVSVLRSAVKGPLYLVGGAVRDLFLNKKIKDFDFVVQDNLEEIARETADRLGASVFSLGRKPMRIFRLALGDVMLDLSDLAGNNIESDLLRRDLTINAMAIEIKTEQSRPEILDPCRGLRDLEKKIVRFVSEENVISDPLRLIRLFRFASISGFQIESSSLSLVKKHSALIAGTAGERIREELYMLLEAEKCYPVLKIMLESGLLEAIIPELKALRDCTQGRFHHLNVLDHTMLAFQEMERVIENISDFFPDFVNEFQACLKRRNMIALLKLTVLMHDLGKPHTRSVDETGEVHFFQHELVGRDMAADISKRLKMSSADSAFVALLITNHLRPFFLLEACVKGHLTKKGIFRLGRDMGGNFHALLIHALADALATRGPAQEEQGGIKVLLSFLNLILAEVANQKKALKANPALVSGSDLMAKFDIMPSPLIGRLLNSIQEAQATGKIKTRDEAMDYAKGILEE